MCESNNPSPDAGRGPGSGPELWRHKKRGSVYEVVGQAQVQASEPLTDYEVVMVYRGPGGLWVRRHSEFHDGRFERLAASPAHDEVKS